MKPMIMLGALLLGGCTYSAIQCSPRGECSMEVKKLGTFNAAEKKAIQNVYDRNER